MFKDFAQSKIVFKLMKKDVQNVFKIMKSIKMVYAHHMILTASLEIFIINVLDVMMVTMLIQLQDVDQLL